MQINEMKYRENEILCFVFKLTEISKKTDNRNKGNKTINNHN